MYLHQYYYYVSLELFESFYTKTTQVLKYDKLKTSKHTQQKKLSLTLDN